MLVLGSKYLKLSTISRFLSNINVWLLSGSLLEESLLYDYLYSVQLLQLYLVDFEGVHQQHSLLQCYYQ